MGSSENFCLRWNDFEANVSGTFKELRDESDFFDVTLVCDNSRGRPLQAHKLILSACSPLFKKMLRSLSSVSPSHPGPLLYLRGVRHRDLEYVLDFMYHGEVNVAQDDLNAFLAAAEDLQVKGLTEHKDGTTPAKRPASGGGGGSSRSRSGGGGAAATTPSSSSGGGGYRPGPASKRRRPNHLQADGDAAEAVKMEPSKFESVDVEGGEEDDNADDGGMDHEDAYDDDNYDDDYGGGYEEGGGGEEEMGEDDQALGDADLEGHDNANGNDKRARCFLTYFVAVWSRSFPFLHGHVPEV